MAAWLDLYPRLATRVIGCPMPTVEAELRNAAEEFFKRTRAWREWLPELVLAAGARQATKTLPTGAYVVQVESALRNDTPIEVSGAFALPTPAALQNGGGVVSTDRRAIELLFDVPASTRLRLQCSLTPTQAATGLPDHLAEQYGAEVAEGAVHRIRSLPLLADAALSSVAFEKFERDVARVGALVHRTHTSITPRRRPHWC